MNWTPEVLTLLDEVNDIVEGLADLRENAGEVFQEVELPQYAETSSPEAVAKVERTRIGPTPAAQLGFPSPAEAFKHFRTLIERSGVFVFVIKGGAAEDWRGLAVLDERNIPLIVINGEEPAPAWKLFTLLHEYYHLLLRCTGISGSVSGSEVEAKCNSFAAHFLMPRDRFRAEAQEINPFGAEWGERHVKELAARFHVSLTAAAIHLEGVGLAPDGFGHEISRYWTSARRAKGGFAEYYDKMANRFGARHFDVVFRALEAGVITNHDAFELTSVKPVNQRKMRSTVVERMAAYGWAN